MYLSDLIGDKEELILAALQHPTLKPKRQPSIDMAFKAVLSEVEKRVVSATNEKMTPVFTDVMLTYELMNGEHGDAEDAEDYASGLDDELEKTVEPYVEFLSQNWLGTHMIDSRLWEENAPTRIAQSMGKEIFKNLSFKKTPAKTLANAGILSSDVELYFDQHMNTQPNETEKPKVSENEITIEQVANTIKAHVGNDFDVMQVYEDIGLLVEDDEVLQGSAAGRLGIGQAEMDAVAMAFMDADDMESFITTFIEHITEANGTAQVPQPASAAPAPAPAARTRQTKVQTTDGSTMDISVLTALKDSGVQDTALSEALGVSRSTLGNWQKGKSVFAPSDEQVDTLRVEAVTRINRLMAALAAIDGTEPHVVS